MDKLRLEDPNPKMLKRFWHNMTGIAKNGDPSWKFYLYIFLSNLLFKNNLICSFTNGLGRLGREVNRIMYII